MTKPARFERPLMRTQRPVLVNPTPSEPPFYDEDAEQAVISAFLTGDSAAIAEGREVLGSGDAFHNAHHREICATIFELYDERQAIDALIVAARLRQRGTLGSIGGKDYIAFLIDAAPTAANVKYHAQIVAEYAKQRRLVEIAAAVTGRLGNGGRADEVRVRLMEQLAETHASDNRLRLYSVADLASLPKLADIVVGVLPLNALVGLIGPKGTMKTMVALDFVFHVALGIEWQGREVHPGGCVYVYAEGPSGAEQRINALIKYYQYLGFTIDRATIPIWFLPGNVAINDSASITELIAEIKRLPVPIVLVVVDTLNRNLEGKEDDQGMGDFVRGCAKVQVELGATVMPVHHTPLSDSDRGRGHGAFDGALDTRLMVSRDDDRVTVECTHQRNGVDGWSVAFEAIPMAGSIVLKPSALDGGQLKGQRRQILELLLQKGTSKYGLWLKESDITPSSFRKARKWLLAKTYIKLAEGNYSVSEAGRLALGAPRAPEEHYG